MVSVHRGPSSVICHVGTDSVDRDRVGRLMTRRVAVTLLLVMNAVMKLTAHATFASKIAVLVSSEDSYLIQVLA